MRAHRLLLTVLLTTVVPATLTAYSGAIGDAALRHSLAAPENAVDTALIVKAGSPSADRRAAAAPAVKEGARRTFDGLPVHVLITGLYRPARITAPYWPLDDLGSRGVHKLAFTTYGPLLTDPSVLTGRRVSGGESAWLVSADFSTVTTDRIGALRQAARDSTAALRKSDALSGTTAATTSLPEILDYVERSLLVSRSTLLIVALLLALLSAYALFLVARLLSAERAGETRLLRARGSSPGRVAGLAVLEALRLAVPAAACAPLLAGPLTRLLAKEGALARIGLRLDTSGGRGEVWLVAAAVALGCALAVTVPALTSGSFTVRRARALPTPVRAGADVGLLIVAGVATGSWTAGTPAPSASTHCWSRPPPSPCSPALSSPCGCCRPWSGSPSAARRAADAHLRTDPWSLRRRDARRGPDDGHRGGAGVVDRETEFGQGAKGGGFPMAAMRLPTDEHGSHPDNHRGSPRTTAEGVVP